MAVETSPPLRPKNQPRGPPFNTPQKNNRTVLAPGISKNNNPSPVSSQNKTPTVLFIASSKNSNHAVAASASSQNSKRTNKRAVAASASFQNNKRVVAASATSSSSPFFF
eukprot:CAMPEP_0184735132 /NCGR_PEP_ID=MMETSP0314-20130426/61731_1 /TAXON_ID=38298 /ORGANISM="Rhodella maculata, Strain CCMP 736" /LENGTH=109 /DNA_ID=CAMNT_0027202159 /DNA_START=89 /DNA_END=418 /DNA_ORIENTATION=-